MMEQAGQATPTYSLRRIKSLGKLCILIMIHFRKNIQFNLSSKRLISLCQANTIKVLKYHLKLNLIK